MLKKIRVHIGIVLIPKCLTLTLVSKNMAINEDARFHVLCACAAYSRQPVRTVVSICVWVRGEVRPRSEEQKMDKTRNIRKSKDEHSSDQACTISMECEEDNAYYDGRREWNFKINTSEDVNSDRVVSAEHIQETENFEETNLTESEDEHSSDQVCTISMECEEDNAYCDDREKPVSTQNSGSSVRSMITSVGLPLKAQGYRLMKSKENDVKSPGRYNAAICAADDSGSSENAGKSYCGITLENMYPQIIQTFSNLWNSYIKNQAADNIVRFHKKKSFV
ncbi:uncharacterized protein [Dendropsophus ebraccatus]|uniref:uncharacterized protein isoform X1 n=1 Tax=Dendropsophus ebraccatus TaxID=150705 RepID=UPI0038311339